MWTRCHLEVGEPAPRSYINVFGYTLLVALKQDRHESGLLESQTDVMAYRYQSVNHASQAEVICADSEVSITLYGHKTSL